MTWRCVIVRPVKIEGWRAQPQWIGFVMGDDGELAIRGGSNRDEVIYRIEEELDIWERWL